MSLLFRKIQENGKYLNIEIPVFDLPEGVTLTEDDLQNEIFLDVESFCKGGIVNNFYGYLDFILFGFRWFYHLTGKPTRNCNGKICSEQVNNILVKYGWAGSPFTKEVPSPCDIAKHFSIME